MAMFSWSTAKHSCKKLVGCNARLMTSNGKGNLMSDPLKAAARAGDPKALEALMNKSLGSRGITVRVTNSGSLLRVLLRGTEAPDRALLPLIQKGLGSIKPAGFEKVVVSARAIGKGDVWTETWQLAPGNAAAKSLSANNTKTPKPVVKTLLSSQQTTQWYQKTWLVVTMLVLFPVAGVPLAWLAQWSKPAKIVSSSIIGGLLVLSFFIQDQTPTPTITAQESQQELSVDEPAGAEVAEAPETAPTDYLAEGKAEGYSTAVAAQTATGNDWNDVGLGWDAAMRSLGKVPADSPDYAEAQSKLAEYTANREVASARYDAHLREQYKPEIAAILQQVKAILAEGKGLEPLRNSTSLSDLTQCGQKMRELQGRVQELEDRAKQIPPKYGALVGAPVTSLETCVTCSPSRKPIGETTPQSSQQFCLQTEEDIKLVESLID